MELHIMWSIQLRFKRIMWELSQVGIKKYGTTLEDSKESLEAFLIHLQEELMDATLYIEKLKKLNV